jgi:hypothetical protein
MLQVCKEERKEKKPGRKHPWRPQGLWQISSSLRPLNAPASSKDGYERREDGKPADSHH